MCSFKLLAVFVSLCSFYFDSPHSNVPKTATMLQCVKAMDVCVDRYTWDMVSVHRVNATEDEIEREAISICDYDINGRFEFSSYHTDNRCGWSDVQSAIGELK